MTGRAAAMLALLTAPVGAEEFDRGVLEGCLRVAAPESSGSECLVPLRHQCNSLLEGGTLQQDIACLERANAAISGWSDDLAGSGELGVTPVQIAEYRRRLRGFCLGQVDRGDKVDEVGFGLCELAGHAALHRDMLRRADMAN